MVVTKKLIRDDHFSRASDRVDDLVRTAPSDINHFEALILRGDLLRDKDQLQAAMIAYLNAARSAPDQTHLASAVYRLGQYLYEHGETEDLGLTVLVRLVRRYPNTSVAVRALDTLDVHFGKTISGRTWLEKLYRGLFNERPETKAAPHLLYRSAMLHIQGIHHSDVTLAMSLLTHLVKRYPRSALWDNAMYEIANIHHTLGQYSAEITALRTILHEREPSYILGNYETQFYHRCSWRIAQLYSDHLGQPALAIRELHDFVTEFKYSRQYDDALFMLARLQRDHGSVEESNTSLLRLIEERPNSRLVGRARAMLDTGYDPGAVPLWSHPGTPSVQSAPPGDP